ncbi:MAG: hypothetical protein COB98_01205 [Flavobacteriaceae bacterium]|nr:MAG: hypothetical protein COB98_01205 [Flavobacteriaceae bacterium]
MKKIFYTLLCITAITFSCQSDRDNPKRIISFSDIKWEVREAMEKSPGPNNWSSSEGSVFIDTQGQLHLKIRKIAGIWHAAEISTQKSFGYGKYIFYVATNVEALDANVVLDLFTYEKDDKKLAIEFTRFGNPSNDVGSYTVQEKPATSINKKTFPLHLNGTHSTHIIEWTPAGINFESYHGHAPTLPSEELLISRWTYKGAYNPSAGNERLCINTWLFQGKPPTSDKDIEIIISKVYVPY